MARLLAIPRLYAIVDRGAWAPADPAAVAARLAAAGVAWIQLRAKGLADRRLLDLAAAAGAAVSGRDATLWVNDRADVAALVQAGGLHLGQEDLPAREARRLLAEEVAIGVSTHTREQVARAADDAAADLLAVGPIFPTASKPDAGPVVGLELLAWARRRTGKPLVAIGGIDATNAARVLDAGADCVAVLGALVGADLEHRVDALLAATNR